MYAHIFLVSETKEPRCFDLNNPHICKFLHPYLKATPSGAILEFIDLFVGLAFSPWLWRRTGKLWR